MNKNILVVNAGSTSVKMKLYNSDGLLIWSDSEYTNNHVEYFREKAIEINEKYDTTNMLIGHRVVSGCGIFNETIKITPKELKTLNDNLGYAPLHNPFSVMIIEEALRLFDNASNFAVFDTTFHNTIDDVYKTFPIPTKWSDKIYKLGAHGISVKSIIRKSKLKDLIVCHLGGGSSVTLVEEGKSVDTSMGLTPLGGVMSQTRTGNLDPSIIFFIARKYNVSIDEIESSFNNVSGVYSSTNSKQFEETNRDSKIYKMYIQNIVDQIAIYLNRSNVSEIIFTGGISENNPDLIKDISLKIKQDITISVLKTDEEKEIMYEIKQN